MLQSYSYCPTSVAPLNTAYVGLFICHLHICPFCWLAKNCTCCSLYLRNCFNYRVNRAYIKLFMKPFHGCKIITS